MTGPIKKARKQRELDELAFNVLSSFRQQGAMQWTDWYETTSARRGERGLGTTTFTADFHPARNERSSRALSGVRNGKGDIADIAVQQLLNK